MTELARNGRKRVVVTGMGAVTPLGETVADFWDGLTAGRSGIGPMTLADPTDYPCRISGEVSGFDPERYIEKREARRLARFSQLAIVAAGEAMSSAGLSAANMNVERVGVYLGNGNGAFPPSTRACASSSNAAGCACLPSSSQ